MFGKTNRNDVLNVVGAFLAGCGSVASCCFFYLIDRWAYLAPMSPDPAHGLVYSYNEHGWIKYFSAFQTTSCALLGPTSILLFFLGIFLIRKRIVVYRRGRFSVAAKWDSDDPKKLQRVGFLLGALAAPLLVFIVGPVMVNALIAAGVVLPSD